MKPRRLSKAKLAAGLTAFDKESWIGTAPRYDGPGVSLAKLEARRKNFCAEKWCEPGDDEDAPDFDEAADRVVDDFRGAIKKLTSKENYESELSPRRGKPGLKNLRRPNGSAHLREKPTPAKRKGTP